MAVAISDRFNTLTTVKQLTAHPAFDIGNPNKVYSPCATSAPTSCASTPPRAVRFVAERIKLLDARNPQVASLARSFDRWQKFDTGRQAHARLALESIRDHAGLSRDVAEVVTRALGS